MTSAGVLHSQKICSKGNIVMTDSRQLAGLIGPTMLAVGGTEAINMEVFSNQIAPVVYLNGTILFVAS